MGNIDVEKIYSEKFTTNSEFQREYLFRRSKLYRKIISLAHKLRINSLLDIGCAYGLLVEYANANGIDAYGLDLPIDNLKQFHGKLKHSQGKFKYNSLEELVNSAEKMDFQLIVILDTLRHIENCACLNDLGAEWVIIKEVSSNFYVRRMRKKQFDIKLWSPNECLNLFYSYKAYGIYPSKFIFRVTNPGRLSLNAINLLFPSYSLILKRRNG